jgi:hypothetical protein
MKDPSSRTYALNSSHVVLVGIDMILQLVRSVRSLPTRRVMLLQDTLKC